MADEDNLSVEVFDAGSSDWLLQECLELRRKVFIEEQNVEESLELDSFDADCLHIAVRTPPFFDDNETEVTVATCRLRLDLPFIKLERVAVKEEWRQKYIGTVVCTKAIKLAEQRYPRYLLVAQCQIQSIAFYENLGFLPVSDTYIEAGISHRTMMYVPRCSRVSDLLFWNGTSHEHHYIAGECWDPEIIAVIRKVLQAFKESSRPRILHYQHLLETLVVGKSIIRAYRECALALQKGNLERSIKMEEFLLALTWEKLNTGHYSLVDDAWRELYTAVSTCKSLRLFIEGNNKEALRACDFGLMMGGDIDGRSLSSYGSHLHGLLPVPRNIKCEKSTAPYPVPLSNSKAVKRIYRPSMEDFLEFFARGEPVVIQGVVTEWPAFKKWSFEYFNKIAGYRTVPVEIGSSYASNDWKQTFMTMHDYIEEFIEKKSPRGLGYLAQHRMFEQMPELLDDLILPDYYSFRSMDDVDLMIWIGPAGTVSPLHTDPKSNIFCQVYGRKFFRLVPYTETDFVYRNTEGLLTNTTQMDVENPDLEKFPLFASAHVLDCVLEAGDSLFIPSQYWHHVRSLDPSISISCWFHT